MTVTTIIDQGVGHIDNVPATDADITDRRNRWVEWVVAVFTYVYMARGWSFRLRRATLTATAGIATLPSDFGDVPPEGGVFLAATGDRLAYDEPQNIMDAQEAVGGSTTTTPTTYGIFDFNTSDFQPKLQLPTTATVNLVLRYGLAPPTLDDSTNTANLKLIPEKWHQSVLLPGLRALARRSLGDGAVAPDFTLDPGFQAGFAQMIRAERPASRDTTRKLPSFFGGF